MAQAILVRITPDQAVGSSLGFTLWAVVTDDPEVAERTARDALPTGWAAEVTVYRLSDETVAKLGLVPGKAWPL